MEWTAIDNILQRKRKQGLGVDESHTCERIGEKWLVIGEEEVMDESREITAQVHLEGEKRKGKLEEKKSNRGNA